MKKIIYILLIIVLSGCNQDNHHLRIDELYLSWLDSSLTVNQLDKMDFKKELIEDDLYIMYSSNEYKYVFSNDDKQLYYIEILKTDNNKLGPRDIRINDSLKKVINKFPSESDYRSDGIFYGKTRANDDQEEYEDIGYVVSNQKGVKSVICIPLGELPFLKINFIDDKVSSIIIYYGRY